MKIIYCCADQGIPLRGDKGASVHLRSLAAALARAGHAVTLACCRIDGTNPLPAGVLVEQLPEEAGEQLPWLHRLLREVGADAALERYSLSSGATLSAARASGIPFVLEVNAPLVEEASRYRGLVDVESALVNERHLLAAADRVIAVSGAIRDHAVTSGAAADRVVVIPNGVEVSPFASASGVAVRRRYGLLGTPVVGFAGSLKPWHGVADLVSAFARLAPETRLLIVGEGPERPALEKAFAVLGIGMRAVITGAVPHAEVPDHLAAMDIAVAPYSAQPHFYFSPLKIAEYLAAGLPVVTTAQGDLGSMVGGAGLLVAPGDVEGLAVALAALLDDPAARSRMSGHARAVAAGLSWDRVAVRVEAVLRLQEPQA